MRADQTIPLFIWKPPILQAVIEFIETVHVVVIRHAHQAGHGADVNVRVNRGGLIGVAVWLNRQISLGVNIEHPPRHPAQIRTITDPVTFAEGVESEGLPVLRALLQKTLRPLIAWSRIFRRNVVTGQETPAACVSL